MKQLTKGAILIRAREIYGQTIERCPQYAERLRGIRFEVSGRMTSCAGKAAYATRTVKLSLPFFADESNADAELFEVVTHELAHLVVGLDNRNGNPHGPHFRMVHRAMGGTGKRCHSMTLADGYAKRKSATRVEAPCPKCGQPMQLGPTRLKRYRADIAAGKRSRYSHAQCPRPGY